MVGWATNRESPVDLLVFRKKDLYLVITQKLTFMKLVDFVKSSRFHVKSTDIAFPLHSIKLKSFCWVILFIRFLGGFHEICRISHEIHQISRNLPDFTKSAKFHEIWWISKDQLPGMVTPMFLCFSHRFILFGPSWLLAWRITKCCIGYRSYYLKDVSSLVAWKFTLFTPLKQCLSGGGYGRVCGTFGSQSESEFKPYLSLTLEWGDSVVAPTSHWSKQ